MNTPVAILFFNRPAFLRQLISRLAEVKPKKLYLVCDGPRHHKVEEKEKVDECRSLFETLSWDCQIHRNYSDANLGCRDRIISGLDWVFEQEEQAIILEDDCIPIADFFPFAEAMLERYKDDNSIFSIGGSNQRPQLSNPCYDVVFSKYSLCWGWATWRRAWKLMDRHLLQLPEAKKNHLFKKWLGSWRAELYWSYILRDDPTIWDYQWTFSGFVHRGLHVLPSKCLVENIGVMDPEATHTTFNPYDLPAVAVSFPACYRVPAHSAPDLIYNKWMEDNFYSRAFMPRIKWLVKKSSTLLQRFHLTKKERLKEPDQKTLIFSFSLNVPVVVLFFNRPEFLRQLINRLSEVKPKKLYLVCDGPRQNIVGEEEKVTECRTLFENLSWECQIERNYADVNLGCRDRIVSGLDWVFEQEERAIILEDDCIPILEFFKFSEEMLELYANDTRIMSVCGTNWRPRKSWKEYSITFSKYPMIWGWATWRRSWQLLDRDLKHLPEARTKHTLRSELGSWRAERYWLYLLKNVNTSWGYRWMFTSFINHGLHVIPCKSLVSNIGFVKNNSTHTTDNPYRLTDTAPMGSWKRIPPFVVPNYELDRWIENYSYSRSFWGRFIWVMIKVRHLSSVYEKD